MSNLFIFCPLVFGQNRLLHGKIQGSLDPEQPVIELVFWKPPQGLLYIAIFINCVISHQTLTKTRTTVRGWKTLPF